jgi:hypothetical protein
MGTPYAEWSASTKIILRRFDLLHLVEGILLEVKNAFTEFPRENFPEIVFCRKTPIL